MLKKIAWLLLALACFGASAQIPVTYYYNWPAASATGPVGYNASTAPQGAYVYMVNGASPFISVDWTVTGTVSACTFRVEASSDATTWTGLDATSPGADPIPCTSGNFISIAMKPSKFIRVYVVSWTGTGSVVFHYAAGNSAL